MQGMLAVAAAGRWRELPPLIWQALHELLWREPEAAAGDDPLRAIAGDLRREPERDSDLRALAVEAGMPWSTFRQRFAHELGRPPLRFLLEERVRLAARLLLERPDEPIAIIAERSGYRDHNHFTRIFRRAHGTTPSAFRRSVSLQGP